MSSRPSASAIKSRFGGKRISFSTSKPFTDDLWRGLPVSTVEISGSRVRFISKEPQALLRGLFQRGLALDDLEVVGVDLEEAFLALTADEEAASA